MALPSSGTLGMNQIRIELGISTQAPFSLDTAENGGYVSLNQCSPSLPFSGNPAAISEWYGYNHTAAIYTHNNLKIGGDCTDACAGPFTGTFYTCCPTFGINCVLRQNTFPYPPVSPPISGYISNGTNCWTVNANVVESVATCAATTTSTTTTAAPGNCKDHQATATALMTWTDCCGIGQSQFLIVGDIFCAEVGTVSGNYINLNTNCNC